ncbi:hypothetical protein M003_31200 [Pseudomonas aeruginosa IGB83]|nr:hypothetical protein M003_31200 [Pseudomonas aeruginosa IGB83]
MKSQGKLITKSIQMGGTCMALGCHLSQYLKATGNSI